MKAELGGKIRDRILEQLRRVLAAPGFFLVEIRFKVMQDRARMTLEIGVLQVHAQFVFRHLMQDGDGVVIEILPAARGVPETDPGLPDPSSTTNCGTVFLISQLDRPIPQLTAGFSS